ncbi:MAG: response regulator [Thermoguttaceae bacterium]|nr:response regulator [Thermoguttaceae bacterium]
MSITAQSTYSVRLNGGKNGLAPRKGATKSVRGQFHIPKSMRALYISVSNRTGSWLAKAFKTEKNVNVELDEVCGASEGLNALRQSVYDVVIVCHAPGELDAPDFIAAYRASGIYAAALVVGDKDDAELKSRCYQVGADDYLCIYSTTVRNLLWAMARALKRFRLEEENSRFVKEKKQLVAREKEEATAMLIEQKSMAESIDGYYDNDSADKTQVTPQAKQNFLRMYEELLRSYVVMGAGCMTKQLSSIAALLAKGGISAREAMAIHLECVGSMIESNGGRSSRHVMARADELIMELLVHLTEEYRKLGSRQ